MRACAWVLEARLSPSPCVTDRALRPSARVLPARNTGSPAVLAHLPPTGMAAIFDALSLQVVGCNCRRRSLLLLRAPRVHGRACRARSEGPASPPWPRRSATGGERRSRVSCVSRVWSCALYKTNASFMPTTTTTGGGASRTQPTPRRRRARGCNGSVTDVAAWPMGGPSVLRSRVLRKYHNLHLSGDSDTCARLLTRH